MSEASTGPTGVVLGERLAVVTGGARGIGRAISRRLAESGAHVVALSRSDEVTDEGFEVVQCDVRNEIEVVDVFRTLERTHGPVGILVNNAGVTSGRMVHREDLDSFDEVIRVNLVGSWLCIRAALPGMRQARQGSIVNVSSMSAKLGNLGQGSYSSAKAGLVALTKTVAREGASHGIRANAVLPGLIATEMTSSMPVDAYRRILESVPLARAGTPDEVAHVVAFLASDLASYVTGAVVEVAGGRGM